LFLFDSASKDTNSDSVPNSVQYVYQQGVASDVCPTNVSAFHKKSKSEAVHDFTFHVLEPLVEQYGLTTDQRCLLERVADFTARLSRNFDQEHSNSDLGIYSELVVRCPEFLALKLDNKIIEAACEKVFLYHDKYIHPDIQTRVANYKSKCEALTSPDADQTCDAEVIGDCNINAKAEKHCDIFFDWIENS
jgi:hypothetical protein